MTNKFRNYGNDVAICRVGNVPEHGISLQDSAVGLRCRNPPMHLSQLNALAIPLM
jgi:hypothetical protein